jgi:hypothetical protein
MGIRIPNPDSTCNPPCGAISDAVKNNPDKFPTGYIIELDKTAWDGLKSKFSTSIKGGKVKSPTTQRKRLLNPATGGDK